MKSGLEDRNNVAVIFALFTVILGLNEVRPGRPEQFSDVDGHVLRPDGVSMKSGLEDRNNGRNDSTAGPHEPVSMKSGLEDRNNIKNNSRFAATEYLSQ